MDIGPLVIVLFAAFTAVLAFGSVVLLCHALKKNNAHVRDVLAQVPTWNDARIRRPLQEEITKPETETASDVAEPAADGTLPYIRPRPTTNAGRPVIVRNEPADISDEIDPPVWIDRP